MKYIITALALMAGLSQAKAQLPRTGTSNKADSVITLNGDFIGILTDWEAGRLWTRTPATSNVTIQDGIVYAKIEYYPDRADHDRTIIRRAMRVDGIWYIYKRKRLIRIDDKSIITFTITKKQTK